SVDDQISLSNEPKEEPLYDLLQKSPGNELIGTVFKEEEMLEHDEISGVGLGFMKAEIKDDKPWNFDVMKPKEELVDEPLLDG
ncbi:hypothetical protein PMAYCL1PPCAC_08314, partial [Pristionchus mayeri]